MVFDVCWGITHENRGISSNMIIESNALSNVIELAFKGGGGGGKSPSVPQVLLFNRIMILKVFLWFCLECKLLNHRKTPKHSVNHPPVSSHRNVILVFLLLAFVVVWRI